MLKKAMIFALILYSCSEESERNHSSKEVARNEFGNQRRSTCLNLVGGQETDEFPAVYNIFILGKGRNGRCTGTFVSPTTMITAAHCVGNRDASVFLDTNERNPSQASSNKMPKASAVFSEPSFNHDESTEVGMEGLENAVKDLAVVVFPDSVAKKWLPLDPISVPDEEELTIVGYGDTELIPSSGRNRNFKKRVGKITPEKEGKLKETFGNKGFSPHLHYTFGWKSKSANKSAEVLTADGDSGGPVISNDTLVGVIHGTSFLPKATDRGDVLAVMAKFTSSESKKLLEKAVKSGAKINYATKNSKPPFECE